MAWNSICLYVVYCVPQCLMNCFVCVRVLCVCVGILLVNLVNVGLREKKRTRERERQRASIDRYNHLKSSCRFFGGLLACLLDAFLLLLIENWACYWGLNWVCVRARDSADAAILFHSFHPIFLYFISFPMGSAIDIERNRHIRAKAVSNYLY